MKFDDLDQMMRVYETSRDQYVIPGVHIVARVDGRSFTRLTKETHTFETPFDIRVRDYMVETAQHLMECGFRIAYGYTQSDEISLLFHPEEKSFGLKLRKLTSILAGEASAKFSTLLGDVGAFDCRICELPDEPRVIDYFRWRQADAARNALNAHCYRQLRGQGHSVADATSQLSGMSVAAKNELLFQSGTNFNDVPAWQKRGVGLYWETYEKPAMNPKTGQAVTAIRHRIKADLELPLNADYDQLIQGILAGDG